jgi:hypothetical protein
VFVDYRLRDQFLLLREREPVSNQYPLEVVAKEDVVARKVVQVRLIPSESWACTQTQSFHRCELP